MPKPSKDIAVTIEVTPSAERVELFARASGLTARETELLRILVAAAGQPASLQAQGPMVSRQDPGEHAPGRSS